MEITNEYLVSLAEREYRAMKHISDFFIFSIFSKKRQEENLKKVEAGKAKVELIQEIQKHLNSK